ncbi:50S ribosomal protein L35 [Lachancea thermotolerans]|uniref:KLTH0B05214p n=1 Tax=Lachancea thermotolerans (strain ATCC 56472 / CBS 6340 / NRRL Y-8284) TaxID=559295 RepID=C5DCR5_LACTC|nr:KLTH0B05214p [Lachancea thermotolerans CBS 6340]CAR21576.1 KLTH0B05214p [Lachancea thermotolerans CBS 6340]
MLSNLMRSIMSYGRQITQLQQPFMMQTRNLMKTHKGTAKRWRKTSTSYKRGRAGRNHGNAGWGKSTLKSLDGKTLAHPTHIKHLKRLLPYN